VAVTPNLARGGVAVQRRARVPQNAGADSAARRRGSAAAAGPSSRPPACLALVRFAGEALFALLLTACATYRPLPLPGSPNLAANLAALERTLPPARPDDPPATIDITAPLDIDRIGVLAMLNDPDLRSEHGEMAGARAALVQASALPNPSIALGFAALLGGPGSTPSYSASLSQDIASLVTYHARVASARSHVGEVNANLLWLEWQIAQKARLLALDLYWLDQSIDLNDRELRLISSEAGQVRAATAAGNLDIQSLAPLLGAQASAEQSLAALHLQRLKNWQALDALLGLQPQVRFAIAAPALPPPPPDLAGLIATLPEHRPDLVALQLGYRSSDENLRAAILGQFPAFVLSGTWTSDTTNVRSAGPNATFDLPIFNRNQGGIAKARATRAQLQAQYQARLDSAVADIQGLVAQMQRLSADLVVARRAAARAVTLSKTAREAYAQGNLDQRALTDYETTALQRQLDVVGMARDLGEDQITLAVELGLGLPRARIAPPDRTRS
jgi:cobalt-zinc-cadmium efflux system outer membrane protein